jgi:hypothetical protein
MYYTKNNIMDKSNYPKISELWNLCKKYGEVVRSKNVDGLEYWNYIKEYLKQNDIKKSWKSEAIDRFEYMTHTLPDGLNLHEDEKDDYFEGNKRIWELHHFYLQHARIPFRNQDDASFVRIFQIAYNAGQLSVELDKEENNLVYDENKKKYYIDNKLNEISSYISVKHLSELEELSNLDEIINNILASLSLINSLQLGGSHINKILKYKYKSQQLKLFLQKHK